jgi:hypothetical protein
MEHIKKASTRLDLLLEGKSIVFVIAFQPTGFDRLFRLPMTELTDRAYEASEVIGTAPARSEALRRLEIAIYGRIGDNINSREIRLFASKWF